MFKVRRKRNRQLCVLKERKFAELGRKRDILNEVALLERLDHPNVIKCYGHFWDHASGALYMVLEYADGGDMYSHVQKRRMSKQYYPEVRACEERSDEDCDGCEERSDKAA